MFPGERAEIRIESDPINKRSVGVISKLEQDLELEELRVETVL